MIYLLWSLLNIGLLLFFIVICFKVTKLVREKYGLAASVILVIGLLSFIGNKNNDNDNKEPNSNHIKTWKFTSADSLNKNVNYLLNVDLEKTMLAIYIVGIRYGEDVSRQKNIPISAYSYTNGFISGTNWKPVSIIVNRTTNNNKFEYFVDGVVEWELLGWPIYSQTKEYRGIALIN